MTLHTSSSQRPLVCIKSALRITQYKAIQTRSVSAGTLRYRAPPPPPPRHDPWAPLEPRQRHGIKVYSYPASVLNIKKVCAEPLKTFNASQQALLDPSGSRTRLFAKDNEDRVNTGDVLLVRFRNGDPFCGICMSIRRRGPDTGILLRNTIARVGAEMWVKIYNPAVVGIEIVQRAERRSRRARLTYLRKPEHDRGDLSNILNEYLKTRRTLNAKRKDRKEKIEMKNAAKLKAAEISASKTPRQQARSKGKAPGR